MIAPASLDRFRADLLALLPATGARLGVACSGGPDSTALLLLAARGLPGRIEAATVDHGLRPDARADALLVAEHARALGVEHAILAGDGTLAAGGNLQARARALRYQLLSGWARRRGLAAILTAHHQEDQAETVLMRLARGAGLTGLSAIRPIRLDPDGGPPVLRPLLGWSRADLAQVVAGAAVATVTDPANHDPRHDRTHFRALLARHADRLPPARLAAAAVHLQEADTALALITDQAFAAAHWDAHGRLILAQPGDVPRAVQRRLLVRAMAAVRDRHALPSPPGDPDVEPMLVALERGGAATLGRVKGAARPPGWRFEPAAPHRTHR